jgi:hypothetical protein
MKMFAEEIKNNVLNMYGDWTTVLADFEDELLSFGDDVEILASNDEVILVSYIVEEEEIQFKLRIDHVGSIYQITHIDVYC